MATVKYRRRRCVCYSALCNEHKRETMEASVCMSFRLASGPVCQLVVYVSILRCISAYASSVHASVCVYVCVCQRVCRSCPSVWQRDNAEPL